MAQNVWVITQLLLVVSVNKAVAEWPQAFKSWVVLALECYFRKNKKPGFRSFGQVGLRSFLIYLEKREKMLSCLWWIWHWLSRRHCTYVLKWNTSCLLVWHSCSGRLGPLSVALGPSSGNPLLGRKGSRLDSWVVLTLMYFGPEHYFSKKPGFNSFRQVGLGSLLVYLGKKKWKKEVLSCMQWIWHWLSRRHCPCVST